MAKYETVARDIIRRINKGEFDRSGRLPTLEAMMASYGVSKNTARTAVQKLTEQGYLYKRQGSGTYIRPQFMESKVSLNTTKGFARDFPESKVESRVLEIRLQWADNELAERMFCDPGTPVYFLKRLRIVDGRRYALELSYFNKDIVPYLSEEIASGSVFGYLQDDLHLKFGFSDKRIRADKAGAQEALLLDLEEGEPVLIIQNNCYLEDGRMFDSSQVLYNYKYANFYASALPE